MKDYLKKIFEILTKKNKITFYFLSFLSVIKAVIEILGIGLLIPVLTFLSNDEKKESILTYVSALKRFDSNEILFIFIIFFLIVYLIKTLYVIFFNWCVASYVHNLYAELGDRLLKNYLKNDLIFFLKNNSAKIISHIASECNGFALGVIGGGVQMISNFFLFFGICSLLIAYNYYSIFIIIILTLVCFAIFKINDQKFQKWGEIRHIESVKFIQKLNEVIGSIKEIILYDKKNFFTNQSQHHLKKFSHSAIYKDIFQSVTSPIIEFIAITIFFSFLSYLVFFSEKVFSEIVIIFGIFAFASIRLLPNLIQMVRSFQSLKFNYPAIDIIHTDLKNNEKDKNKNIISNIDNIIFEKVNFTYPENSVATLNDISFKINAGDRVGIVGRTGSGKTTLINLISGLLSPTKGKIKINKFKEFDPTKTKLNIGYVSQFVYLSDDNIINNIALSDRISIKNKDFITKILKMLNLIEFTKNNKRLSLGERGARVSGGQIQRIGIARALYRNPSLLVLDEATNALDEKTENKILAYLFKKFKNKIIIFCTHKKKLLKYCNKIIEIKDHKINFIK